MDWISGWYIGLYICLIVLVFFSKILKSKFILYFFVLLLIVFSGFRHGVGIDFFVYEHFIKGNFPLLFIEPLNRYLIFFARYYDKTWIFFLTTSIIYISTIMYGLKRVNSFNGFTVFVFTLFTLSFLTSFGFVRQFVAIGVFFIGFIALFKAKNKQFFILGVIATLFHYSAVIFLLLYFIRKFLKTKKTPLFYFIAFVGSLVSTKVVVFIVNKVGFYAHYTQEMTGAGNVAGEKIYASIVLVTLFIMFLEHYFVSKQKKTDLLNYSQNMVFLFICIYSAFLPFGEKLVRISYYLVPFYYVWMYQVFKGISSKSIKEMYMYFIIVVCTFYYFTTLFYAQFSSRGDFLNNYSLNF